MDALKIVAVIMGIILGSGMLVTVMLTYYKSHKFGLGGTVMTLIGTVLVGTAVWGSVQLNVSASGGFEASFMRAADARKEVNKQIEARQASEPDEVAGAFTPHEFAFSAGDPIEFHSYDPAPEVVAQTINNTSKDENFNLILSDANDMQSYIQATRFPGDNEFWMEYREGSEDKHFYATGSAKDLLNVVNSYMTHSSDYKTMVKWDRLLF